MAMTKRFRTTPKPRLVLRRGNETLLMLRRFNSGYADGQHSVMAGNFDGIKAECEACARETQEESERVIDPPALDVFYIAHRMADAGRISFFFTTEKW